AAVVALVGTSLYLYREDHQWMPVVPSLAILAATVILSYLLPSPGKRVPVEPPKPETKKTVRTLPLEAVPSSQKPLSMPRSTTKPALKPLPEPEPATAPVPDPWEEAFSRVEQAGDEKKKKSR